MKKIDIYLQNKRIKTTIPFIKHGMSILDIGCSEGELFRFYNKKKIKISGIGVDPDIKKDVIESNYTLIKDYFPSSKIADKFDVIIALAVLEHIPEDKINHFILSCKERLNPGGKVILTVPHSSVDYILHILMFLRLIDGMETEQHHGFEIKRTIKLFENCGLKLFKHKYFQFGLNNLFVFSKNN